MAVLAAAAVTYALPFRQPDCNTTSHFALIQALAAGDRTIDRIHGESCDISWFGGHFYSNKAPGLALVTLPWYELLHAAGALRADPLARAGYPAALRAMPRRNLWLMGLWGAVLPALGAVFLAAFLANRWAPGTGSLVAATLGFATLLLPFGSLFFSHALAAFVALLTFALVVQKRLPFVAGAVAGAGIVVEYPLTLLAIVLTTYVSLQQGRRRGSLFAAGAVVGVLPLFAFNTWVYGSPLHLSYVGAVLVPGVTGHDVLGANRTGFFGVGWPTLGAAFRVLAGRRGLLSVAPVLILVPIGIRMLWREGRRSEAALIGTVGAVFLLYNFGYYTPLAGATPGPRLLVCILGVLVVALAPIYRTAPLTSCVLLLASAVSLLAAHLTQPLISGPFDTGDWWEWLRGPHFTATILRPTLHTWPAAAPIALSALVGIAVAGGTVTPVARRDTGAAIAALTVWVICLLLAPTALRSYAAASGSIVGVGLLAGPRLGDSVHRVFNPVVTAVMALSPLARILWLTAIGLLVDIALRLP